MSKGWRIAFRHENGIPFGWSKDYPGKGSGSVKNFSSASEYDWIISVDPGDEGFFIPWDFGKETSLRRAMQIVDEQFELIEAL